MEKKEIVYFLSKIGSSAAIIINASNGAIFISNLNDEEYSPSIDVFEFNNHENDLVRLLDLHYGIDEFLGILGSKYDKYRVIHKLEHGEDYECKDLECEICKKI